MKKFLCLALVLLLLLPMVIACKQDPAGNPQGSGSGSGDVQGGGSGSGSGNGGNGGNGGDNGDETDPIIKYNMDILDYLPEAPNGGYNGKKFNVSMENDSGHIGNFYATEITGDLANDTLYRWITKIETTYGVDVTASATQGTGDDYAKAIVADLKTSSSHYQLYGIRAFQSWQPAVQKLFLDWNSLSKDWITLEGSKAFKDENGNDVVIDAADRWDVPTNGAVTFNGKFYTATGDLGVSKLKNTMATFYHVDLLEQYGVDNGYDQDYIYGLVDEGDWTLDKMEEIAKDVYNDNNRDGLRDAGDTYGYYSNSGNSYDIWAPAMGVTAYEEDAEGRPVAVLNKPENITKLTRVREFYHNNRGVMPSSNTGSGLYPFALSETSAFVNGQSLFVTTTFSAAYDSFQRIGTEAYGIMPQPMYDEDQGYYMSYVNDNYTVWAINCNLTVGEEQNFAAHITDALCAESANQVYYQFYDILLKQRYSKDKETAGMVDKVMENVLCDATRQFGNFLTSGDNSVEGYTGAVRNFLKSEDYDFETKLTAYEEAISAKGGKLDQMFEQAYQ